MKSRLRLLQLALEGELLEQLLIQQGSLICNFPLLVLAKTIQLSFSCVGYKAFERNYNDLVNNPMLVKLSPASLMLDQVNVKPVKFKTKTFGRTGSSALMSTKMISEHNHTSDELGKEIGTVIDIDKNCRLNAFSMHIIFNHFNNIKFRFNIIVLKTACRIH